jgi:WD40 repeat protein
MRPGGNLVWACSPLRFTPDGGRLVLGTSYAVRVDVGGRPGSYLVNKVRLWDLDGERETGDLPAADGSSHESPTEIFVHPRGDRLTVVSYKGVRVVELASGKVVRELPRVAAGNPVLSRDGGLLAGWPVEKVFHLWRTGDGKELRRLDGLPLAFSPDGKWIAAQHEGKLRVYDVRSGKLEVSFPGKTHPVGRWVAFTPDGKLLAWNAEGKVSIADREAGKILVTLEAQPGPLAFAPDGATLALACADSTALLWDVRPLCKGR